MKPRMVFHVVAATVLVAAVAAAQSPDQKAKPAPKGQSQGHQSAQSVTTAREAGSGMATGRQSGSGTELNPASVTTARETGSGMATGKTAYNQAPVTSRETGSGMATGKRVSGDPHEYPDSGSSAHATESLNNDKMQGAQSNPLYKDGGLQGTNPLYQGKDKTAKPAGNGSHETVEYKDGEDGVTRSRPGNNKPQK